MSNDISNDKVHGQHGSVTDHASKVFKESSVCAVSRILSNENKPRKIFRTVVFLLFTVAFFFQFIAFLWYVLQYPTVVDFELSREEMFLSPAYTFCNFNPIKRSKFCAKYPNNCTKPDKRFCDEHPRFCGTPDTLILKENDFNIDNMEEVFHLSHEAEDMFDYQNDFDNNPVTPLPRSNPYEMDMLVVACYSFNDRVNSPLDFFMKSRAPLGIGMSERYRFDPQENEALYPETETGIMFQVHSPFEAVNPFETGYFMRPGYFYRIAVKLTQEEFLPDECLNYTDVWLKNNETGYRSQAACKQKCIGDIILRCLHCTEPYILYPYPNETFCSRNLDPSTLTEDCRNSEAEMNKCINECKEECVTVKFSYEVQESYRNKYVRLAERNESREIRVKIEFPEVDIQKIVHKRQFQVLEIFSLIGGLLAFWIGLSMVQVVEVFDCIFQIAKCLFKKRSTGSESSAA